MFKEVPSKVDLVKQEEKLLQFWQKNDIFRKSVQQREGGAKYVFYEGPPTANGMPHIGHVLTRVVKDLFPRYHAMKGEFVLRKGGWDCHGLPVEIEVEKELGFSGKPAIEKYGIERFNNRCRESVFRYVEEWNRLTERIGFWIDLDDPYVTLTNNYIESVWWILRQLWDKELLYQGYKVVPYCPRCGTSLSDHEVAQGYAQATDPSLYVKFPIVDNPGTYFLVWTTTPWTLPGNVALAVHPQVEYVQIRQRGEELILARELLEQVIQGEYEIVRTMKGKNLIGKHYRPLYTFLPVEQDYCYVISADFVTTTEGTGIVHIAPAFGMDDMEMGRKHNLPLLQTVGPRGNFIDQVTPWRGHFVKDADPLIVEELRRRGLLYHIGEYEHTYPFCWRCDTPLLYYAKTTWYVRTTARKDHLLANNEMINWYPEHIKRGRFGDWLSNNVDWALGRERYWGTPLPIWECNSCQRQVCVDSVAELERRTGLDLEALDLHRPHVDAVSFKCEECGGEMRRVPEVIDAWFDSGSMPVAQWHYPFENEDMFKQQFPADFISEAVDQTRGWFYTLHAISTLLFDKPCFRNCIVLGLILDSEGRKMSKSGGNAIDPGDALEAAGADAVRWYLLTASPPWNARKFSIELTEEVLRRFLLTIWNTYSFFVTYANIDGFDPRDHRIPVAQRSNLDRWILAELNATVQKVTEGLDAYAPTEAARPIEQFVDFLSNWYVRRSRRRFWKSEHDEDKASAHLTLYECLTTLIRLLAPFTPFITEELHQNLVRSLEEDAPESVHLADFPVADESLIAEDLIADTRLLMRLVSLGHSARNYAGIKVRQPLAECVVKLRSPEEQARVARLESQFIDELNVKALRFVQDDSELVEFQVSGVPGLLGKKHGALFPKIRTALAQMDPAEVAALVRSKQPVELVVDGQEVSLLPDEVGVRAIERQGYSLGAEGGYLVAIPTEISDDLLQEGLAREVVRRIHTMRKDAGFRIEDTIRTYYQADEPLVEVLSSWGSYVRQETLSVELLNEDLPTEAYVSEHELDGHRISLGLVRQ
jgi:isoleucyl-tRNA synthetase